RIHILLGRRIVHDDDFELHSVDMLVDTCDAFAQVIHGIPVYADNGEVHRWETASEALPGHFQSPAGLLPEPFWATSKSFRGPKAWPVAGPADIRSARDHPRAAYFRNKPGCTRTTGQESR